MKSFAMIQETLNILQRLDMWTLGMKKMQKTLKNKEGLQNGKMKTLQSTKHFATECGDCNTLGIIKMEGSSSPEVL